MPDLIPPTGDLDPAQTDPVYVTALFRWPLGDDAALIPRTVAIAEAHQALFAANYERLRRWFPFDRDKPPTLKQVRKGLARRGQAWLDGSQLPLAIVVKVDHGWRLAGQVDLLIERSERSGAIGWTPPSRAVDWSPGLSRPCSITRSGHLAWSVSSCAPSRPTNAAGAWPNASGSRRRASCAEKAPSPTGDVTRLFTVSWHPNGAR
jgi:hypothetical protein